MQSFPFRQLVQYVTNASLGFRINTLYTVSTKNKGAFQTRTIFTVNDANRVMRKPNNISKRAPNIHTKKLRL